MGWNGALSVLLCATIFNLHHHTEAYTAAKHNKVVVCYVGTWAVYRPGKGSFSIDHIDPTVCTHLIYAFAGLDVAKDSIKSLDAWQDLTDNYGKGGYKRMTNIKNFYPHIKISLAIGGWNEGSANYSALVKSAQRRSRFISSVIDFIRKYKFDGLDLDWEFPGKRGGDQEDKHNFLLLVKELKSAFRKYNLLLTAAIGAGKDTIDVAYDVGGISNYLDYIHVMCYDYHGAWDGKTGPNAPLRSKDTNDTYTVEYSIKYLIKLGAAKEKLVLGVPLYGRTFLTPEPWPLDSHEEPKFGAVARSFGFQGPFTKENGFMGYNEICLELQNTTANWKTFWDEDSQTPLAVSDDKVISYDNERSIVAKVRFAIAESLGGIMVWSMDTDDFHGDCSVEKFPLMKTINKAIEISIREVEENRKNEIPDDEKTKNNHASSTVYEKSCAPIVIMLGCILNKLLNI